jgi:quinol monooxygenase YgiN
MSQAEETGGSTLIIVTGSIVAKPDSFDELRALSLQHVRRSRSEPGCLSHAVHIDAENPLRLVFLETWADRAAITAHFAVSDSLAFVKAARQLALEPPLIQVYDAKPLGQ